MAFKMKGSSYKMGGHKTKATMAYMKSPLEQAKPDYPDIDGDGNTTESMKKAAADKKSPMEQKEDLMVMATRPGSRIVQKGKKTKVYSKEKDDAGKRRNITKTVVNEKTGKIKDRKISEARAGRQIEKAKKRAAKGKGSVSSPLEQEVDKGKYGRVKTPYDADRSSKPPTQMKSPLEQKLGFMDKLSSVGDAFKRYDGPFGASSIYDEYKESKKNKREDMRREEKGHTQVKGSDAYGNTYWKTVDKDGNEVK